MLLSFISFGEIEKSREDPIVVLDPIPFLELCGQAYK